MLNDSGNHLSTVARARPVGLPSSRHCAIRARQSGIVAGREVIAGMEEEIIASGGEDDDGVDVGGGG